MTAYPDAPIDGIDHVAILVRDLDAALPYYRDTLGWREIERDVNDTAGVNLLYLDAGNLSVQLVCPYREGAVMDHLDAHGEGLHHICFRTPNIEDSIARLAPGADVRIMTGELGIRTCFLPDRPNGLIMELAERTETGPGSGSEGKEQRATP
jgi:methylmalonyl-CoA/ethylmalonyl-CoA epimerase